MRPMRNCCTSATCVARSTVRPFLRLHQGEILGLQEWSEPDASEGLRCIAGPSPRQEGSMRFAGVDCPCHEPFVKHQAGIVPRPEDRNAPGSGVSHRSALSNLMLADLHAVAAGSGIESQQGAHAGARRSPGNLDSV